MKIYSEKDNVYDAVNSILDYGVAILSGTKTPAIKYANKIIECLEPYNEIEANIGFQLVKNEGYFYYVHDLNRFPIGSEEIKKIVIMADKI